METKTQVYHLKPGLLPDFRSHLAARNNAPTFPSRLLKLEGGGFWEYRTLRPQQKKEHMERQEKGLLAGALPAGGSAPRVPSSFWNVVSVK